MSSTFSHCGSLRWLGAALILLVCHIGTGRADSPPAKVQNVLLIVSDDLKASVLGCYGDRICRTPNIDKLASQSLVFDRAYCQGTWCAPSRTSFMFSRYQGKGVVNLGEHFIANQKVSARVGKIFHMRVPGDIVAGTNGPDVPSAWTERFNSKGAEAETPGAYACLNQNIFTTEMAGRQSTAMPHRMFVTVKQEGDGSDQPDYKTATKTIELLQKYQDKPFFIAAGFVRPHYPMVAPKRFFQLYPWQNIDLPLVVENDLGDIPRMGYGQTLGGKNRIGKFPDNQKRMWTGYYASVSFMDQQVGRVLDELDRLGLRETTAVVFTSDHGYHLGEHTFWQKSNLHEEVARVPLIISAPSIKPARSNSFAELVDLFPTLSDLAGLEIPESVQGSSLLPVLRDPTAKVREGALTLHKGHAWRTDHWAYMRYNDGTEELYDMVADPGQFTNLASDEGRQPTLVRMRDELAEKLKSIQKAQTAELSVGIEPVARPGQRP